MSDEKTPAEKLAGKIDARLKAVLETVRGKHDKKKNVGKNGPKVAAKDERLSRAADELETVRENEVRVLLKQLAVAEGGKTGGDSGESIERVGKIFERMSRAHATDLMSIVDRLMALLEKQPAVVLAPDKPEPPPAAPPPATRTSTVQTPPPVDSPPTVPADTRPESASADTARQTMPLPALDDAVSLTGRELLVLTAPASPLCPLSETLAAWTGDRWLRRYLRLLLLREILRDVIAAAQPTPPTLPFKLVGKVEGDFYGTGELRPGQKVNWPEELKPANDVVPTTRLADGLSPWRKRPDGTLPEKPMARYGP